MCHRLPHAREELELVPSHGLCQIKTKRDLPEPRLPAPALGLREEDDGQSQEYDRGCLDNGQEPAIALGT